MGLIVTFVFSKLFLKKTQMIKGSKNHLQNIVALRGIDEILILNVWVVFTRSTQTCTMTGTWKPFNFFTKAVLDKFHNCSLHCLLPRMVDWKLIDEDDLSPLSGVASIRNKVLKFLRSLLQHGDTLKSMTQQSSLLQIAAIQTAYLKKKPACGHRTMHYTTIHGNSAPRLLSLMVLVSTCIETLPSPYSQARILKHSKIYSHTTARSNDHLGQ